jgi:hypothetical protein
MKTFIFLLLVIIGLFGYILFYTNAQTDRAKMKKTPSLDKIEQLESEVLQQADTYRNNSTAVSTPSTATGSEHLDTTDMHTVLSPKEEKRLAPISENVTFEQLQAIIVESNPRYPKSLITLNSYMRSLLPNDESRSLFKAKIAQTFHLSDAQIEEAMQKNRLLWDWVNLLR